jgi:hypothetical protein
VVYYSARVNGIPYALQYAEELQIVKRMGSRLRQHCSTPLVKSDVWPADGFVKTETFRLFEYVNKQVMLD